MSQNSNFTNIKSIHIDYTLFMSISLSILSLKLSMTMGTLYTVSYIILLALVYAIFFTKGGIYYSKYLDFLSQKKKGEKNY